MPRPPAGTTTAPPFVRSTAKVPSAPPPWPTTLIAIVAIPWDASTDATTHGAPYMLSVKPCPKIATGLPVELDCHDLRERKHRAHRTALTLADHELHGCGVRAFDLVADLLQIGC